MYAGFLMPEYSDSPKYTAFTRGILHSAQTVHPPNTKLPLLTKENDTKSHRKRKNRKKSVDNLPAPEYNIFCSD